MCARLRGGRALSDFFDFIYLFIYLFYLFYLFLFVLRLGTFLVVEGYVVSSQPFVWFFPESCLTSCNTPGEVFGRISWDDPLRQGIRLRQSIYIDPS